MDTTKNRAYYWKRGWWVWLMLICVNIGYIIAFLSALLNSGLRPFQVVIDHWTRS
jgi:hypothetical protein